MWVTAMFFFMVMLAVGYGYALWLTKLRLKNQLLIHGLVLTGAVTLLLYQKQVWSVSVTPGLNDLNLAVADPTLSIILVLLITIGLPFALLSSSSTLLQFWYARLSQQEPFSLYGVSNVGSLLGLLTFPFLFEPMLSTVYLGQIWANGFFVYVFLLLFIGYQLFNLAKAEAVVTKEAEVVSNSIDNRQFFRWLLVASVPVLTMLAGTAFLTTSIAPVPMLWVGPLALYLISFIVSFRAGTTRLPVFINEASVLVTSAFAMMLVLSQAAFSVAITLVLVHVAMFSIFHWCHEYLYATRPVARELPIFYIALALGGILGSVVMLVSTLYLLVLPIELLLVFIVSVLVVTYRWYKQGLENIELPIPNSSRPIVLTFIVSSVIIMGASHVYGKSLYALEINRNFFGYKAVLEYPHPSGVIRALQHGMTNHGFQRVIDGELVIEPVSYFGESSGIGKALTHLKEREESLNVLVLGLGAGGLAAYCRPTDKYEFIEIDPQVINLAKTHFTYLNHCPQAVIVEADGRLALAKKPVAAKYDMIILDAYSDDMMPIHIMTNEALSIYKKLLQPDGLIAMNISSRFLDLLPVVAVLAESNNLALRTWYDRDPENTALLSSHWVLFALDDKLFDAEVFAGMSTISDIERRVIWSDTYSALWPVVELW